jgi:hypothetical protein
MNKERALEILRDTLTFIFWELDSSEHPDSKQWAEDTFGISDEEFDEIFKE